MYQARPNGLPLRGPDGLDNGRMYVVMDWLPGCPSQKHQPLMERALTVVDTRHFGKWWKNMKPSEDAQLRMMVTVDSPAPGYGIRSNAQRQRRHGTQPRGSLRSQPRSAEERQGPAQRVRHHPPQPQPRGG